MGYNAVHADMDGQLHPDVKTIIMILTGTEIGQVLVLTEEVFSTNWGFEVLAYWNLYVAGRSFIIRVFIRRHVNNDYQDENMKYFLNKYYIIITNVLPFLTALFYMLLECIYYTRNGILWDNKNLFSNFYSMVVTFCFIHALILDLFIFLKIGRNGFEKLLLALLFIFLFAPIFFLFYCLLMIFFCFLFSNIFPSCPLLTI